MTGDGAAAARGHAAHEPAGGPQGLNIGEVLGLLRDEFPDVTLSKIRFLETEGLVEPARTSANYRKYRVEDVDRLRFVLSAQRDRYLPLRVIKEQLADREPQRPGEAPPLASVPPLATDLLGTDPGDVRIARRDLLAQTGLTADQLAELERAGLLAPPPGGTYYDGYALVVARTAAEMARFGIEPRHLRVFRTAADREVGLVEQGTATQRGARDPGAAARAREAARELSGLCVQLHAALLEGRVRTGR